MVVVSVDMAKIDSDLDRLRSGNGCRRIRRSVSQPSDCEDNELRSRIAHLTWKRVS